MTHLTQYFISVYNRQVDYYEKEPETEPAQEQYSIRGVDSSIIR